MQRTEGPVGGSHHSSSTTTFENGGKADTALDVAVPDTPLASPSSGGVAGLLRAGVGGVLARWSPALSKRWLNLTGAKEGDRIKVAESAISGREEQVSSIISTFNIEPLAFIRSIGAHSPIKAYRILKELSPEDPQAQSFYLSLALERGIDDAYKAVSLDPPRESGIALQLFSAASKDNPLRAIRTFIQCSSLPEPALTAAFDRVIEESPLELPAEHALMKALSRSQRERLTELVIAERPALFFAHQSELCKDSQGHDAAAFRLLEDLGGGAFLKFLHRFSEVTFEAKTMISKELLRENPIESLEAFDSLVAWGKGAVRLEPDFDSNLVKRYWLRILAHRESIGFTDPAAICELLTAKCATHPDRVLEHLSYLGLAALPFKDELALKLAECVPATSRKVASALKITSPQTLEKLLEIMSAARPSAALSWCSSLAFEVSQETKDLLIISFAEKSPWKFIEKFQDMGSGDTNALFRAVVRCAETNSSRLCKERKLLHGMPQAIREQAFVKCGRRNIWTTLDHAQSFGVAGSPAAKAVFARASKVDPLRALQYIEKLDLKGSAEHRGALLHLAARNSSDAIAYIKKKELPEDLRCEILTRCLRRNPSLLPRATIKHLPAPLAAQVVAAAAKGNIERAAELSQRVPQIIRENDLLITACALENFKAAQSSARSEALSSFTEPERLNLLIAQGIIRGRWESALDAARELSKKLAGPEGSVTTTEALTITDAIIEAVLKRSDLAEFERSNAALFKEIRKARCIPTDLIQRTFDHFGPDDHPFILDLLKQGGSTVAELNCEILLSVYGSEVDILPIDRTIIMECTKLGFRGLSPRLLPRIRSVFETSIIEGREVLKNYQALAERVLMGLPIPAEWENSPFYPGLIASAFRPVGMTERVVRDILDTIEDQSEHLADFHVRSEGYAVRLAEVEEVQLHDGQKVDYALYAALKSTLSGDGKEAPPLYASVVIKRLLQGAFDQLDAASLWALFGREVRDPRIAAASQQLAGLDVTGASLSKLVNTLSTANEAFSVIAYDSAMELAKSVMGPDCDPRRRFRVDSKSEAHVRRILHLTPERKVTESEILLAIGLQAEKLFRREKQAIQHEAKKFTQHFAEMTDRYVMYISKSKPSYFGRAGAGLCTAEDNWSWRSPTFLQMMMIDKDKHKIVGNVQLHLFENVNGEASILARLNPTSSFIGTTNKHVLAEQMLKAVWEFADDNGLIPYLPEQTAWHELTNRDSFSGPLQRFYGKSEKVPEPVQIAANKELRVVRKMLRPKAAVHSSSV
ncbi:MAG: hypothetical protein J5J00_02095 [Deltaproteobacteria bacterium]|nr:hypothetical protein [Deltaproteobacteria bacterium]